AELHRDVFTARELSDVCLPRREYLVALAGVWSVAQRAAAVADDDIRVGTGPREIDRVRQLRMELPRVERQTERGEPREPRAEVGARHQVRGGGRLAVADDRIRVPRGRMADAAEAAAARAYVLLEHGLDAVTQGEVREADDAGRDTCRAVLPAVAH